MTTSLQSVEAVGGGLTKGVLTLTQAARSYLRWMEAHGYARNTLESYGRGLSGFLRFADGLNLRRPEQVTVLALDGYFLHLRDHGRSARTVAHHRSVLVALWAWLEHEDLADKNIAAKTYPVKYTRRAPRHLEEHAIDDFLAKLAALTDLGGRRDYAIVAMLFYGGLRVGELVSLRLEHVDLRARRIRVLHGKGDRDRTIVLPPGLAPILETYLRDVRPQLVGRPMGRLRRPPRNRYWHISWTQAGKWTSRSTGTEDRDEAERILRATVPQAPDPGFLFVNASRRNAYRVHRAGKPLLTRSIFQTIADRTQAMLGVRLSPHKLRHTCASYLLMHDVQLETIQRHLGHQDVHTTMIYLHVPRKRQEEEIGRAFA